MHAVDAVSGDGAGNNASATPYFVDSLFRADAPVADEARKAAAATSLWMFVALLAGAFFASVAALSGGRQRDSRARARFITRDLPCAPFLCSSRACPCRRSS